MSFIQEAFKKYCPEAKEAKGAFVCLMEKSTYYGGPEEGGWWGTYHVVVGYQWFDTEEAAEIAHQAIKQFARELSAQSRKEYEEHCLQSMGGLDADYLPEPDEANEYYVIVTDMVPESHQGTREYS